MTAVYISLGVLCLIWYIVNIFLDLTRKDPSELIARPEDEEVDISDEAGQFQPILIEKVPKKAQKPSSDNLQLIEPSQSQPQSTQKAPDSSSQPQESNQPFDEEEPGNRKSLSDLVPSDNNDKEDNGKSHLSDKEASSSSEDVTPSPKDNKGNEDNKLHNNLSIDTKPRLKTSPSLNNITQLKEAANINPDLPMVRIDTEDPALNTHIVGAIKSEDLVPMVNDFAEKGKESKMADIFVAWETCLQEQDAEDIAKMTAERKASADGKRPSELSIPPLQSKDKSVEQV